MWSDASLLNDCYSMDKSCGISDAVAAEIRKRIEPAALFLEQGTFGQPAASR
jgi:hypothetical protein